MKTLLVAAAFVGLSFSVSTRAQDHHSAVQADAVKWGAGPAAYPRGAQFDVMDTRTYQ